MREKQEIDLIIELLSIWIVKIEMNTALTYYDINKVSENLAMKLLNILYDFELKNMNFSKSNYCGIDLGDERKAKLAFQVTSRTDTAKIKSTLSNFIKKEYYKKYINGIRFLILNRSELKVIKNNFKSTYENFDVDKHIITYTDLIRDISNLYSADLSKFNEIKELLLEQLNIDYAKEKIKNQKDTRRRERFLSYRITRTKLFILFIIIFPLLICRFYDSKILNDFILSINDNKIRLLAFLSILLTFYILLKISDKKFKELEKEHFPEIASYRSKEKLPIRTKVSKDNSKSKQEVIIYNSEKAKIEYIRGRVLFYNDSVEVEVVEFEEYNIEPLKGKVVFNRNYASEDRFKKMYWDEFHTYIDEIKIDGEVQKDIKVYGTHFIRTYFLLLNKYKYLYIGDFKVLPYEISWLKRDLWLWTIKPWFFNGHNIPRIYSFSGKHKEPTSYVFVRIYKRLIRLAILLLIAWYLCFALKGIVLVLFKLVQVWLEALFTYLK